MRRRHSVTGRVTDVQNAAVVECDGDAHIIRGTRLESRTGGEGTFSFDQVAIGTYTLQIDAPGFSRWSQDVRVGDSAAPLNVTLRVAGLNEAVSVLGVAPATLATPTLTGTRLGLTPLETPASVSILSGDTIRERGDQTVADAKTRAVGVTMQGDPGNGGNAVVARGFGGVGSVMQLFDGDQLFVGAGTVTFPFDPWTVERIEVLGGPASVLYGNGAIGGAINVVPRKPNPFARDSTVRVAAGSFNTWRGALDTSGPINSSTSYRLDVSSNRSSGWVNGNDSNSTAFSASLRHRVPPRSQPDRVGRFRLSAARRVLRRADLQRRHRQVAPRRQLQRRRLRDLVSRQLDPGQDRMAAVRRTSGSGAACTRWRPIATGATPRNTSSIRRPT